MENRTVEELIWLASEDERKRGPAGLSFAPVYSFLAVVAHMARSQERQAIIDAITTTRPRRKSVLAIHPREVSKPDAGCPGVLETRSVEELIWLAVEDERKRSPVGLSFAPVYSFVAAVAHMVRGQERQTIMDAITKIRPEGKSAEYNEGYDAALMSAVRLLIERSITH